MTDRISALIFGPSLQPAGEYGSLIIREGHIEVQVRDVVQQVPLARISLREVGFGQSGLELAWSDDDQHGHHHWAVHVLDAAAAQQLLRDSPLATMPQAQTLQSRQRRHRTGRFAGWSLLGLFVSLPLLALLVFFWQADRIAGWAAGKISIEQETALGRSSFESMRGSLKLIDHGPAYEAVTTLGQRLTQGSKYTYEFHVVDDATLNAFALPGGVIVVHTGLINATRRPEELAGVLAHEVQHVELRHSLQGMAKQLGLRALWAMATGDLGGTLAGQAAVQLSTLKFSRDAETEADEHGFDLLVRHGIDPGGMADFFHTMSEKAADAPASFLSTHPLSKEREQSLEARRRSLGTALFNALDMGAWPPK